MIALLVVALLLFAGSVGFAIADARRLARRHRAAMHRVDSYAYTDPIRHARAR